MVKTKYYHSWQLDSKWSAAQISRLHFYFAHCKIKLWHLSTVIKTCYHSGYDVDGEASQNSLTVFTVHKATVTWRNRMKRWYKNMNHPSVLLLYPPQSIPHFVLPSVHTCTCLCSCAYLYFCLRVCTFACEGMIWWLCRQTVRQGAGRRRSPGF